MYCVVTIIYCCKIKEEDFAASAYGFTGYPDISTGDLKRMFEDALDCVTTASDFDSNSSEISKELQAALSCRLKFRLSYWEVLEQLVSEFLVVTSPLLL